ncbi:zinc metalloproteinase nas-4-like [Sitodiplosis mosellana]|uniref:zinc metalloproteinase nas-4-like n=1 Tax=Sitodiplosis mosellana TaxID=263140 RepID=UPI002443CD6F|nr:zinc metalloproteinase nas-4-like [Sitodiplosis mosellana]
MEPIGIRFSNTSIQTTCISGNPEYGKWFQGDIVLTKNQKRHLRHSLGNGLIDSRSRWPKNTLIYDIGRELRGQEKLIQDAMSEISKGSCIKFKKRTNEKHYVHFQATEEGCYSLVGYTRQKQPLNLGRGCEYHGTAVHEIMHALGFLHMQSSFDRDKYIKILWENISKEMHNQFQKYGDDVISHMGGKYDYASIMHYGSDAFSKNGKMTIKAKDPSKQKLIGNRKGMTKEDMKKLNHMYKCHKFGYGKKGVKYCSRDPTLPGCQSSLI